MIVLGIESSCDDTAIAIVENGHKVLFSGVSSQMVHETFGGVVPEIAAREHLKIIHPLATKCFKESKISPTDLDIISVTSGPGLVGSLLVGVSFAKGLALSLKKPLVPVDHVKAHVHGSLLAIPSEEIKFPLLAFVVSGGHTHLYKMTSKTDYKLLLHSVDDACGECFDKVAKLLKLGYPGGPIIEKRAEKGDIHKYPMPTLLNDSTKMFFSYSGLKTHMVNTLRQSPPKNDHDIDSLCAGFQEEAFFHLIRKLKTILKSHKDINSIVVSGGVSANSRFKSLLSDQIDLPAFFPPLKFCSDNAAMVASYGYYLYNQSETKNPSIHSWDVYSGYKYE